MSADPDFPHLDSGERITFPPVSGADHDGVVAVGANLSPGVLLSAYEQGIFPWFEEGLPILWWSPDPRFVLHPEELHIPRRLKRVLRNGGFELTFDADFDSVISLCSRVPRRGQQGTWITQDMIRSYRELHRLGHAHSVEVYRDGRLVGGLYGLLMGQVFCGESMFSLEREASKVGFVHMLLRAASTDSPVSIRLVDSQMETAHMAMLGARSIPRGEFIGLLSEYMDSTPNADAWKALNEIDPVDYDRLAPDAQ